MKRLLPFLLLGVIAAAIAGAADRPAAEIVDYGIYKGELNDPIMRAKAPSGYMLRGRGLSQLAKQTTEIPATLGTQFGFRFVVHGNPGAKVPLHFVWLYPAITNHQTRAKSTSFEVDCPAQAEDKSTGIMWTFTDPAELVEGEWTFQVLRDGEPILEKQFQVRKPDEN
jgi:hypothetical protein